jgi:hypothetical protein
VSDEHLNRKDNPRARHIGGMEKEHMEHQTPIVVLCNCPSHMKNYDQRHEEA